MEQMLREKDKQLEHVQGRFNHLREDYTYNLRLLDERDALIGRLQSELKILAEAFQAQSQHIKKLKAKLETAVSLGQESAGSLEAVRKELEALKTSSGETIAKLRADAPRLEGKYQKLLGAARAEAAVATKKAQDADKTKDEAMKEADELRPRLRDAEGRAADTGSQLQVTAATLREADLRIQQLEHEMERQRLRLQEAAEKQLKRDVTAVKKYYECKIEEVRAALNEEYEAKYAKVLDSVQGVQRLLGEQKGEQAARLAGLQEEVCSWRERSEELQEKLQQEERRVKQLSLDYEKAVKERDAILDVAEQTRAMWEAPEAPPDLGALGEELHKDLKSRLNQALEARDLADGKAWELQAEIDKLRLEMQRAELSKHEDKQALAEALTKLREVGEARREAEDAGNELRKLVAGGLLLARLAEGYVRAAASAARCRAATQDVDAAVDEQMLLKSMKRVVKRRKGALCAHAEKEAAQGLAPHLSEEEARQLAADGDEVRRELQRCAALSASEGPLGAGIQREIKDLKRKHAKAAEEIAAYKSLLQANGIAHRCPVPCRMQAAGGTHSSSEESSTEWNVSVYSADCGASVLQSLGSSLSTEAAHAQDNTPPGHSGLCAGLCSNSGQVREVGRVSPASSAACAPRTDSPGARRDAFVGTLSDSSPALRRPLRMAFESARKAAAFRTAAESEAAQAGIDISPAHGAEAVSAHILAEMQQALADLSDDSAPEVTDFVRARPTTRASHRGRKDHANRRFEPQSSQPTPWNTPVQSGNRKAQAQGRRRRRQQRDGPATTSGAQLQTPRRWSAEELGMSSLWMSGVQ